MIVHRVFSPLEIADPMAKRTRVAVKILEGKNLLVSDLLTGTSDPVVLLWVSSSEEGEVDFKCDKRVQVCMSDCVLSTCLASAKPAVLLLLKLKTHGTWSMSIIGPDSAGLSARFSSAGVLPRKIHPRTWVERIVGVDPSLRFAGRLAC